MCWPANISGAFFLALLIFDVIQKEYSNLPYHSLVGILVTGMLWVLCILVGANITGAVLLVPCIFIAGYFFTIWFINESLKQQGCCMKCGEEEQPKGTPYLVKKDYSASTPHAKSEKKSIERIDLFDKLLPDIIKKPLGISPGISPGINPISSSKTCINTKLTATPLTA